MQSAESEAADTKGTGGEALCDAFCGIKMGEWRGDAGYLCHNQYGGYLWRGGDGTSIMMCDKKYKPVYIGLYPYNLLL